MRVLIEALFGLISLAVLSAALEERVRSRSNGAEVKMKMKDGLLARVS